MDLLLAVTKTRFRVISDMGGGIFVEKGRHISFSVRHSRVSFKNGEVYVVIGR